MNIYQVLKRMLCFIMFVSLFTSCQKDEETSFTLKGDLIITFLKKERVVFQPAIYVVGEPNSPLFASLFFDENGIINIKGLNFGNYVLEYTLDHTNSNISYRRTFQIKAGELTELTIQ